MYVFREKVPQCTLMICDDFVTIGEGKKKQSSYHSFFDPLAERAKVHFRKTKNGKITNFDIFAITEPV